MSLGGIQRPCVQQLELVSEPGEKLFGREEPRSRRGELDRKRQPIEALAQLADLVGLRVEVNAESTRPLGEQLRASLVAAARGQFDLAREMKALAARREDGDLRAAGEHWRESSCARQDLLEVVEDEHIRRAPTCVARSPSASSVDVIAGRTCSGSRSGASSTNQTPSGKAGARSEPPRSRVASFRSSRSRQSEKANAIFCEGPVSLARPRRARRAAWAEAGGAPSVRPARLQRIWFLVQDRSV